MDQEQLVIGDVHVETRSCASYALVILLFLVSNAIDVGFIDGDVEATNTEIRGAIHPCSRNAIINGAPFCALEMERCLTIIL